MSSTNDVGNRGEALAASFLESKGYRILARNYRFQRNEVDLVCRTPGTDAEVVFVEVKTRSGEAFGPPEASVTPAKQEALVSAARGYLHEHELEGTPARFDVVAVRLRADDRQIDHYENAFLAP